MGGMLTSRVKNEMMFWRMEWIEDDLAMEMMSVDPMKNLMSALGLLRKMWTKSNFAMCVMMHWSMTRMLLDVLMPCAKRQARSHCGSDRAKAAQIKRHDHCLIVVAPNSSTVLMLYDSGETRCNYERRKMSTH